MLNLIAVWKEDGIGLYQQQAEIQQTEQGKNIWFEITYTFDFSPHDHDIRVIDVHYGSRFCWKANRESNNPKGDPYEVLHVHLEGLSV